MIGLISMYAGAGIPEGHLPCDGSSHPTVDYPELAALLGDQGGQFVTPNFSTRVPIGGAVPGTKAADQVSLSQQVPVNHSTSSNNNGWRGSLSSTSISNDGNHNHSLSHSAPYLGSSQDQGWMHLAGGNGCSHNMGGPAAALSTGGNISHAHSIQSQSQGQGGNHSHSFDASGSYNHNHSCSVSVASFTLPGDEVPTMPKTRSVNFIIKAK